MATQSNGQPHAALVTPAAMPDASLVVLLSGLSEHTRQVRVDPRCAILFTGTPTAENPQTAPRLVVSGRAGPEHDSSVKERWLRLHPYAASYAGLADFTLWRIHPLHVQYVGGFARAAWITVEDFQPDRAGCLALAQAEPAIIAHCNTDHARALNDIASAARPGMTGDWRMVVVDTDGCDLASGDLVHRVRWSSPVSNALQVRSELVRLAHAARN